MKNKACIILLATITTQATLFAGGGSSGTQGGGQTVDVNGTPVLRDLVDKTVCLYIGADKFGEQLPHFKNVISTMDQVHWYLRESIEDELKLLKVCQTRAPLIQIPVNDRDGLTIEENQLGKQVAIRLNDQIFIDMNLFEEQDEIAQAYTLLHEVVHSFIPMKVERRNSKLRSFVAAVRVQETQPMPYEDFALQLSENSLTVPGLTKLITDQKAKASWQVLRKYKSIPDLEAYLDQEVENKILDSLVAAAYLVDAGVAPIVEKDAARKTLSNFESDSRYITVWKFINTFLNKGYELLRASIQKNDVKTTEFLLSHFYSLRHVYDAAFVRYRTTDNVYVDYAHFNSILPSEFTELFYANSPIYSDKDFELDDLTLTVSQEHLNLIGQGKKVFVMIDSTPKYIYNTPNFSYKMSIISLVAFHQNISMLKLLLKFTHKDDLNGLHEVYAVQSGKATYAHWSILKIVKSLGWKEISKALSDAGAKEISK